MDRPDGQNALALRATIDGIDADLDRAIEEIHARCSGEIRAAVAEANRRRRGLEARLVLTEVYASLQDRTGQQGDTGDRAIAKRPSAADDIPKRLKVRDDGKKRPSGEVILRCLLENGGRTSTATVRAAILAEGWTKDAGVKARVRLRERGLILVDGDDLILTDRAKTELMEVEVE